jgi:predicted O-methyltransferase YrrM
MSRKTSMLEGHLYEYLLSVSLRETPAQRALREETDRLENANMRTSSEQVQFMALLLKLIGARRVIEVGTFTGYGTLAMASVLPEDGRVVTCDISEEWTTIARRHWRSASVDEKIDLRIAPALETLDDLLADGSAGSFDFAFIDADKENIRQYYERCLALSRPGGLMAVDNVLWGGRVVDPSDRDESTQAIREFNQFLHHDDRVDISLVPIADGLFLARRRIPTLPTSLADTKA